MVSLENHQQSYLEKFSKLLRLFLLKKDEEVLILQKNAVTTTECTPLVWESNKGGFSGPEGIPMVGRRYSENE